MSWITLVMVVPLSLITGTAEQPSPLVALVSPGGGVVIVKRAATDALVDVVSRKESIPAIKSLCAKSGGCKAVGAWDQDGEMAGGEYSGLDANGKRTDASTLIKADVPFDRATYIARTNTGQDVHRFAGFGPRIKAEVGKKPLFDDDDTKIRDVDFPIIGELPGHEAPGKTVPNPLLWHMR